MDKPTLLPSLSDQTTIEVQPILHIKSATITQHSSDYDSQLQVLVQSDQSNRKINGEFVMPISVDCNDKDMSQTTSDPTAASEERTGEDMSDQSDDDIEKSAPLSSFTWEAYELSSDWNKSLKGDHGILAALDLSLPLPMCNVDLSSPTKPRDILEIFGDVIDLPPLIDRMDSLDDRQPFSQISYVAPSSMGSEGSTLPSTASLTDVGINASAGELDRSNTLMTPQELERMPDQGLEFEQSVGPKDPPKALDSVMYQQFLPEAMTMDVSNVDCQPIVLNSEGDDLTTITVMTTNGQRVFRVNTQQLKQAASAMQPVIIQTNDEENASNTLVMMPVSKIKLIDNKQLNEQNLQNADVPKFKCLYCSQRFTRSYRLKTHEMTQHTGEKPFVCTFEGCTWAFPNQQRLQKHVKSHVEKKHIKCKLCERRFSSKWNLRAHMTKLHSGDGKYDCKLCSAPFTCDNKLRKHMTEVHPEVAEKIQCPAAGCEKTFTTSMGLERHVAKIHRPDRGFTCPYEGCGATFAWQSRFNIHVSKHTGEKKFKCTFQGCAAAFPINSALRRHMKCHKDVGHLACATCGKTFHRPDHLKAHEACHMGVKFPCTVEGCKHSSSTETALRLHLKRHALRADRAVLTCPHQSCEQQFPTKAKLLIHINANHQDLVASQYLQDLTETHALGVDHDDQELVHAAAEASAPSSEQINKWMDFEIDQQTISQPLTVISTEVNGAQVDLLLPDDTAQQLSPSSLLMTSVITAPTIKPKELAPKKTEKGAARTDRVTNEMMCTKARSRQQDQKKKQIFNSIPVNSVVTVENDSPIHLADVNQLATNAVLTNSPAAPIINTSHGTVAISFTPVGQGETNASDLEQWYTVGGGSQVNNIIATSVGYTTEISGANLVTVSLANAMDDDVTDFTAIYSGLDQLEENR